MSSLRNSLHRRNHKERSQLAHRSRLGILEKHKDYVLRARDYHSKQERITRLRRKAADKNKDEFYFGMVNQRTEKGVHIQDRGNVALPTDIVKVLKSQDENYVRTMRTANMKKIDNIKRQLSEMADLVSSVDDGGVEDLDEDELRILQDAGLVSGSRAGAKGKSRQTDAKHIIFVDNEEDGREYKPPGKSDDGHNERSGVEPSIKDLGWKVDDTLKKRRKQKTPTDAQATDMDSEDREEEAKKSRVRLLKELSARLERDQQMRYAERELEMQKLLMGKGGSRKLRGVEEVKDDEDEDNKKKTYKPRVYKWRPERKR